jgi:hypothetical protein
MKLLLLTIALGSILQAGNYDNVYDDHGFHPYHDHGGTPTTTPEPATLGMLAIGLGAMIVAARRKK